MEDIDKDLCQRDVLEDDLFYSQVICGDAELLYMDAVLREVFQTRA